MLLSKKEIKWYQNEIKISQGYERKLKSDIKKKLKYFKKFELPVLIEKGLLSTTDVIKFSNGVTKYSNRLDSIHDTIYNIIYFFNTF